MTDKKKILAEIERLKDKGKYRDTYDYAFRDGNNSALDAIARFINSLPEEPVSDSLFDMSKIDDKIQYANIEVGIHALAEDYSFNIESELFNQLTKEQQELWRKEIEQAIISGGYNGINLANDPRYKENSKVKEMDLIIHTVIAECCDWLAMYTNLSHDKIESCRNLMLTVKDEQLKARKGE